VKNTEESGGKMTQERPQKEKKRGKKVYGLTIMGEKILREVKRGEKESIELN